MLPGRSWGPGMRPVPPRLPLVFGAQPGLMLGLRGWRWQGGDKAALPGGAGTPHGCPGAGGALPHALPRAGCYSLSVRDGDTLQGGSVKHYKIRMLDSGGFYISPRSSFDTLQELVEHYKGEPRGCCSSMTVPGRSASPHGATAAGGGAPNSCSAQDCPSPGWNRGCAMSQAVVLVSPGHALHPWGPWWALRFAAQS